MRRREFFDQHARGWDSDAAERPGGDLARVVAEARLAEGNLVLDIGTGTAVLIPHVLGEIGARGRVLGVDVSRKMLAEARAKLGDGDVLLCQADVHNLCTRDGAFDCVICNAAFPHFEERERALREMIRALRPQGMLVISHPVGREAVNARHRAAGGPVGEDRVPAPQVMEGLLRGAGLGAVVVIDEPEFYLARGRRPA